jgi:K(+)-stimulated pyrophosphate-energized sodium pump
MNITVFEGFRLATLFEQYALIGVLAIAVIGLLYAGFLTRQILKEPEGNEKMKHISNAIRTGGNAYLNRQFRTILMLLVVVTIFVFALSVY